jgi:hypothetical protein
MCLGTLDRAAHSKETPVPFDRGANNHVVFLLAAELANRISSELSQRTSTRTAPATRRHSTGKRVSKRNAAAVFLFVKSLTWETLSRECQVKRVKRSSDLTLVANFSPQGISRTLATFLTAASHSDISQ